MKPLPKKPKDEFSDKLGRSENKQVVRNQKERATQDLKRQKLLKEEGGREKLMDFIFGKTKVNPMEDNEDKKEK